VPFQGAKFQPWHRDFPSPPETYEGRRITSLAFNLSGATRVTRDYHAALPESVRKHLVYHVVEKLIPVTQKHDIEGLVMGGRCRVCSEARLTRWSHPPSRRTLPG
jgi:hypothetical protein